MGLNDLAVKLGKLEERVNALERDILAELQERKDNQKEMRLTLEGINKKVYIATGFLAACQIVLGVVLRIVFK